MAFDLSTAVEDTPNPANKPRKFDLSTAQPDATAATQPGGPRRYSAKNDPSYLEEYGEGINQARQNVVEGSEQSSIPKVLQPIVGAAEGALALGTGAVAPVPGAIKTALAGLTGQNIPYTEARDSYVYEPRSLPGQTTMGTVGAVAKPVTDVFEGASGGVKDFAKFLGASPEDAEQIAAPVMDIGTAAIPTRLARPKVPKMTKPKAAPEGKAKLAEMRQRGIKVTPKEASEMTGDKNYLGRTLQAIGGDSKITKDMAAKNAPVMNEMARKAVGSDSLTETGLKPVKDAGNAVYEEMATLGQFEPQQPMLDAIEAARGSAGKSTKRNTEIDQFVDGILAEYQNGTVDAGQVVNRVRELRRDAQNSRKGEGDKRPTVQQEALGEAQRKVADALDDALEYQAALSGKPELATKYKENRTRLAKVGTVEGASRAGNINAKELYSVKQKGAPLSGNLKEIADAHEWAPGSTSPAPTETLLDAPGRNLGLGDLLMAVPQAAARHMGVNKLLQSEWYQNLIGGPTGGPIPLEHDPNPNAFRPPMRAPEPAPLPPGVDFEGELGLVPDTGPRESLPGGQIGQPQSDLQLVEDVTPAGAGPNALRNGPDEVPFEAVNPEDVAPYRINTDMNFNDARPVSGAQRGAAVSGAGDLELMPDSPPGPYQELPPKPRGRPRQGGAPRERPMQAVPTPPPAAAPLDEGLSELGALIDQMLNPTAQQGIVPGTKRVTGYRGVPEGVDPFDTTNTHGNALFFTPDEATARNYGSNVVSRDLEFSNLLESDTLETLRQALGLTDTAELLDIIGAARSQGYDGVTYDLKPGREYIQIPRASNE